MPHNGLMPVVPAVPVVFETRLPGDELLLGAAVREFLAHQLRGTRLFCRGDRFTLNVSPTALTLHLRRYHDGPFLVLGAVNLDESMLDLFHHDLVAFYNRIAGVLEVLVRDLVVGYQRAGCDPVLFFDSLVRAPAA